MENIIGFLVVVIFVGNIFAVRNMNKKMDQINQSINDLNSKMDEIKDKGK